MKLKPGSKKYKNLKNKLRQFGLTLIWIGIAFFINSISFGIILITIGVSMYIITTVMTGFESVHEEPNWELVYPELALGYVLMDNLNSELDKKES